MSGALAGRTVLVTGAAGFVGRHLVRALCAARARVFGLGLDPGPAGLDVERWETADLRSPAAMARAVAALRPDAVVHLAGQSSAARSFEDPVETFEVNVLGTWNLLEAVRGAAPGARTLVVASGEVYGPQAEGERATEETPFRPVSPYALSKATADALAEAHARAHALNVIRVRAFAHVGPGQDERFFVPSLARQIVAAASEPGEAVLQLGNLDVVRDVTDVRDVAHAYVRLLIDGRPGRAYNVCRGEGVALAEIVRRLAALAAVTPRIVRDPARMRPADVPRLVGDPGRIAADVGWRAEIPLDTTLHDVLEDARERVRG